MRHTLALILPMVFLGAAGSFAQEEPEEMSYEVYVPPTMIRGETYTGLIVASLPVQYDTTFGFGSDGDIVLPETVTMRMGTNHASFQIIPIDSTIFSGQVTTQIRTVIPDGTIRDISVETHPGVGIVSRLWVVGAGADGNSCGAIESETASSIVEGVAGGIFERPESGKTVKTRMTHTTVHVFLTDRYCTPVQAPAGGVQVRISSDTDALTFGGRTYAEAVIPQGHNSVVLDVRVAGSGTLYATGTDVAPDSIKIESAPAGVTVHLGVSPQNILESSYGEWFIWLEKDGVQFVPDGPVPVYLVTDNPVLASFDRSLVDRSGPAYHNIRPHQTYLVDGVASGRIHTGTPAGVGDVRLLAGDRDITMTAHVEGLGSASDSFEVGIPGSFDSEIRVDVGQVEDCIAEGAEALDGFYSKACTDMWQRLLVASHFFDVVKAGTGEDAGAPIGTPDDTVDFLNGLFGGDNTEQGHALFDLVNGLDNYALVDNPTGGMRDDLQGLLASYLDASDIRVQKVAELGRHAELLQRMPESPPPNMLRLESFPGMPGITNVVISTLFSGNGITVPVYIPDGTITLSSDWGIDHEPEIQTHGSADRPEAPGSRASAITIPVEVRSSGTLTASFGGTGSASIDIEELGADMTRTLEVATLPGTGERDTIAFLSVVDGDGFIVPYDGPIQVTAGQGTSDISFSGLRNGVGTIRGSVTGIGEIVIHTPGIDGSGTALTTPVRHEVELDVWHPEIVHVSEEFPLVAHTLDSDGLPVKRVPVSVSGNVRGSGTGVTLNSAGTTQIIVEHQGMFHAGEVEGFLNQHTVSVDFGRRGAVELNDTISVDIDTGIMPNPNVEVYSSGLTFSGEHSRWVADATERGQHDVEVRVLEPGWDPYRETLRFDVSNMLDIEFGASTDMGDRPDIEMDVCGEIIPNGITHSMMPGLCNVMVPGVITHNGVEHILDRLTVNGAGIQNGATYNFDEDALIDASYVGIVRVEAYALYPDGSQVEILYGEYGIGNVISVDAGPEYEYWGLIWNRPVGWEGLPLDALTSETGATWLADRDATVFVSYERDITYLVALAAAALGIPVAIRLRHRIPGVRFR